MSRLDPRFAPEPEQEFIVVTIYGSELEILLYEDKTFGGWIAECSGYDTKYARTRTAALEAQIENLEIELYTEN